MSLAVQVLVTACLGAIVVLLLRIWQSLRLLENVLKHQILILDQLLHIDQGGRKHTHHPTAQEGDTR